CGVNSSGGLCVDAVMRHTTVMWSGRQVAVALSRSDNQALYRFSYVNPYYTEDGVSRGFSVFFRSTDLEEANIASYTADSYGGSINFGYPLSETQRLGFSAGYTNTVIKTGVGPVQEIQASPRPLFGLDSVIVTPAVLPVFDDDDNLITPAQDAVTIPVTDALLYREPGFLDLHGKRFNDFPLTVTWLQSALNRGRLATRGYSQQLSLELTL